MMNMTATTKRKIIVIALMAFSMGWMTYAVIDYASANSSTDGKLLIPHPDTLSLSSFKCGDGVVSPSEDIGIYGVCPMISLLIVFDLMRGSKK